MAFSGAGHWATMLGVQEPRVVERKRLAAGVADVIQRTGLKIGPSTAIGWALTGEPYITLMNGGIKAEGRPCPSFKPAAVKAVDEYLDSLEDYIWACVRRSTSLSSMGWLYWRQEPAIESEDGRYVVSSRILVGGPARYTEDELSANIRAARTWPERAP